jgi:hypothetical protein
MRGVQGTARAFAGCEVAGKRSEIISRCTFSAEFACTEEEHVGGLPLERRNAAWDTNAPLHATLPGHIVLVDGVCFHLLPLQYLELVEIHLLNPIHIQILYPNYLRMRPREWQALAYCARGRGHACGFVSYLDHVPIAVRTADILLPQVVEQIKLLQGRREHVVVVDLGATRPSVPHMASPKEQKAKV